MEIAGIVLILIGLAAGTYGAYIIYRADYPRNDWILEALVTSAQRPTYGVIAPSGYDPSAEREQALARAREFVEESKRFVQRSRLGMGGILIGFVLQALGNGLLLWAL